MTRLRLLIAAVLAALSLLAPAAAHAAWLKAESPRFIVYSNGSEKGLRGEIEKLEAFDGLLRRMHGLPADGVPARRLEFYLVADQGQAKQIWPAAGARIGGFYWASGADLFAVAVRDEDDLSLLHEYTHHFMKQYFPHPYPGWLVEAMRSTSRPSGPTRASWRSADPPAVAPGAF